MLQQFLIVLALVLGNGLLAGAEISVLTIRKSRVAQLAHLGGRGARSLAALRDGPERFLATVQVGVTVVGAASAAYGGEYLGTEIAAVLQQAGLGEAAAKDLALAVVVAGVSYLSLVLGELVPKSLALRHAEGYALLVARPLRLLSSVLRPLVWFLTASSNVVLRILGQQKTFSDSRMSREELHEIVAEAARTGSLDPRASEIARRAVDFGERTVAEVMVPRDEMVAIHRGMPPEEVQRALLEAGHSRMPVFDDAHEAVVGYVIAKDVLALIWERSLVVFQDIIRPACFVPATTKAIAALRELQLRRMQMAIVLDEQGGVVGLVTIEDLVEELVGEIFSEHEAEKIGHEPGGAAVVAGTMSIRVVNRELGLHLPEQGPWTTVAGLCVARAGWIPKEGTQITLEDGTRLEVVTATNRRVVAVRILPRPVEPRDP